MSGIHPKGSTVILLLAVVYQFPNANSQKVTTDPPDIGMCQSEYLEQPPDQLTCNPYLNAELKLECTVSLLDAGPLSTRVTVDWFYSASALQQTSTDEPLAISRLDNVQENVTIREQVVVVVSNVRVRSRLEVLRLDEMNVGQYWCGIRINSMEWMVLSDPVLLQDPQEYAELHSCSTTSAQSKQERKCATWSFRPSVPQTTMSSQSTDPPSMAPSTLPTTQSELEWTSAEPTVQSGTAPMASTSSDEEEPDDGLLVELYITIGILGAFGSIITALVSLVACMCIKYRIISRGKRRLTTEEEKAPTVSVLSPSTVATDYLVPLSSSMVEQREVLHLAVPPPGRELPPVLGNDPVYLSGVRRELTTLWLRQQQRTEGFEHSYETMTHDYEDIFMESLNGGSANPVLMKANEAYIIPRTLSSSAGYRLPL